MLKINIHDNYNRIPSDTIGIDMGQSLTKIAYLDKEELTLKSGKYELVIYYGETSTQTEKYEIFFI